MIPEMLFCEATTRFELVIRLLQSLALPLGHVAMPERIIAMPRVRDNPYSTGSTSVPVAEKIKTRHNLRYD